MEVHRITLQLAEGLAGCQLQLFQGRGLELPEQYSTCQVAGLLRLMLMLQMVAVGVEDLLTAHQVALEVAAAEAAMALED